jgi:creatinine amidohydrolase/Fe(II)-dependent formamide hydrolase-like protein
MEVDGMSANRLLEMLPSDVEAALQSGNDIAIVPIYSIEQHGPHLLLGTDSYGDEALVQELGRITGGMVLPAVPFSWVGCTNAFSGGVGVREAEFIRYLRAVVRGLWRAGFRRIVIWNGHGGNYYAMRTFPHEAFREDGIPVLTIYGLSDLPRAWEMAEEAGGEAGLLTGALRILGREDLVQKVIETNRKAIAEFGDRPKVQLEPRAARDSRRLGVVGHDYSHECLHVQPDSRVDPDRGAEVIRKVAEHVAGVLEDFGIHVRQLLEEGRIRVGQELNSCPTSSPRPWASARASLRRAGEGGLTAEGAEGAEGGRGGSVY